MFNRTIRIVKIGHMCPIVVKELTGVYYTYVCKQNEYKELNLKKKWVNSYMQRLNTHFRLFLINIFDAREYTTYKIRR